MEIVRFEDVKESIINNMRRSMLIPIIGSGLTRKCRSLKGVVPSGDDYRKYMLEEISQAITLSPDENERLKTAPFSTVSEVYYESGIIPLDRQRCYLRDNFTHVQIEDYKQEFLSLPWPYIYTLNIDDGIEQSSKYNHVVHSNRDVDEHIFDEKNCVIKLHGDVNDMLTYKDANGTILTQKQYANSIRQHSSLLTKLEHDSIYENLIYIGCSLDDEIDLLAYTGLQAEKEGVTIVESDDYREFSRLYDRTMQDVGAEDFYFFPPAYYSDFQEMLKKNLTLCFAMYQDTPIAGSMFMFFGDYAHYHLSGRDRNYHKLAANNAVLWYAIKKAKEMGCKWFHFGGGTTGEPSDPLLHFKRNFSKESGEFWYGKRVHDPVVYDRIVDQWKACYPESYQKNCVKLLGYREINH